MDAKTCTLTIDGRVYTLRDREARDGSPDRPFVFKRNQSGDMDAYNMYVALIDAGYTCEWR